MSTCNWLTSIKSSQPTKSRKSFQMASRRKLARNAQNRYFVRYKENLENRTTLRKF